MRRALQIVSALVVLAGASGSASAAADASTRAAFDRAITREAWARAIKLGTGLDERTGGRDPSLAYNMACAHAASGEREAAGRWLVHAARRGFSGLHLARTDPDLDTIRDGEAYARAIAAMEATAAARLAWFRAQARDRVPVVMLPAGHDPRRPAPLIVALHGSGGTGAGLARHWRDAAAAFGAILVAPDALRPAGDGFEWRFVDEADWLVRRTIEDVAERHAIDRDRIVLTGFSQGANIALVLGLREPARFCGLIPIAGHIGPRVLGSRTGGETDADRARIALVTGGKDPSVRTYRRGARELRASGFETRLEVFPGVGHELPPRYGSVFDDALRFVCSP